MDENWTKELDGKTPSSDDKELVKRMREDELKKNSENESEHVTSVFQRVAQRAMGQEKKPAMAKPVADQRPKPAEPIQQEAPEKEMPQNTQEFKEQFFSDLIEEEAKAAASKAKKPAAQPNAQQPKPASQPRPAAQPSAQQPKPASQPRPAAQPSAQQPKPASQPRPAAQPSAQQPKPASQPRPAAQPNAQQPKPASQPRPAAQPNEQQPKPEEQKVFHVGKEEPKETDAMETVLLPEESPEEEDQNDNRTSRVLRNILIVGIALVAVVIVVFLLISSALFGNRDSNSSRSDISSTDEVLTGKSITGVITALDAENERATVYTADSAEEIVFDLAGVELVTDEYGNQIGFTSLTVGQVVDVSYQEGSSNRVERFRLSSGVTEIQNAYGIEISAGNQQIRYNGQTYDYDDHLVCTYGGEALKPEEITEQYVMNLLVVNQHVYSISVMQAVGTVTLTNMEAYVDAKITFTPTYGDPVEVDIVESMKPIVLTEGFNRYTVEKDGSTIASGTLFVEAGIRQELHLPEISEETAVVDVNVVPEGVRATVTLDGEEQEDTTFTATYGEHELVISAEGYETVTQTIDVSQPYMQVTVELRSTMVTVSVTASMSGVAIYCDGEYMGTYNGRAVEFTLPYGTYYLVMARVGYEAIGYDLVLDSSSLSTVNLYFSQFNQLPEESSEEESSRYEESSRPEESSSGSNSSHESSSYPDSSREESSYEDSSYEDSSYEDSSYEDSSYEDSSYEESSYEDSSYQDSSYEDSSYEDSSMQESSQEESSLVEESSYEESSYEESSSQGDSSSGETSSYEESSYGDQNSISTQESVSDSTDVSEQEQ